MNSINAQRFNRPALLTSLVLTAGSLLNASALAEPLRAINPSSKNYNDARSNTAARAVAVHGTRTNGSPYAGLWDPRSDTVLEMPDLGPVGSSHAVEILGMASSGTSGRGPGQPVKGISVGLNNPNGPVQKAIVWDTRDDGPGTVYELPNPLGGGSWANAVSTDGSVIGGALYGNFDGSGNTRRAVLWRNGVPSLLPVPAGTRSSEVVGVSPDGQACYSAISEQGMPSDQPKMKPANSHAMISTPAGNTVIYPSIAGPDANGIAFTGLSPDGGMCFAAISTTRSNAKGGLYRLATNTFSLLDGGDLNADAVVDANDDHDSAVYAVSSSGSIAGGSITPIGGSETATVWLPDGLGGYEAHNALEFLDSAGVTNRLTGWTLTSVTGISPDGSMLSGNGIDPFGYKSVWAATIPTPGSFALVSLGGLMVARRRR